LLEPLDFIARLCALIPPPRFHMLRYHGVLAAHSSVRAEVVPGREPAPAPPQLPLFAASDVVPLAPPPPPSRHPWDWLLKRVFAVDVSVCPVPGCEGRMRVVEIATSPDDMPASSPRARVTLPSPGLRVPPGPASSRSPSADTRSSRRGAALRLEHASRRDSKPRTTAAPPREGSWTTARSHRSVRR
jgi:hypothetical protein